MPRNQARLGDTTNHGGVIITSAKYTTCNGILVARKGDLHACPIPGHGITQIVTGSPDTFTEGRANARIGDKTGCGASISKASNNTDCN